MKARPTAPTLDIEVVTHYYEEDEKCYGDYASIDLLVNGELVTEFADYYHEKGLDKIKGFFLALDYIGIPYNKTYKNVNDAKY